MASRIQGITVEIGGDTTKLSKALESVNKSIKGTQSGLKDVNKLLKLDPSNTELVVQKQKMLKDAIEATKEKLATLKTAAQQAKGNTIRYAFNAASLKQSTVAWKNSPAGLFVSTDGGKTWGYGWESDDTAVQTAILLEQTLKELDDRYKKANIPHVMRFILCLILR